MAETCRVFWCVVGLVSILLLSTATTVSGYLEKKKRCAAWVAMIDEIIGNLEKERPQQSIAVGDQNPREFKPYATSELRTIEILDDVCDKMRYCT